MGGAATEVSTATRDVLIEAAEFDPVSIRNTARQLEPAQRFVVSFRAAGRSRRARLGQPPLLRVDPGTGRRRIGRRRGRRRRSRRRSASRSCCGFRSSSGFSASRSSRLTRAGDSGGAGQCARRRWRTEVLSGRLDRVVPPSWRRDLSREIDLIEEVGADSRLRRDSRGRERADGRLGAAAAGPRAWRRFAPC